jgi:hypothetical protein
MRILGHRCLPSRVLPFHFAAPKQNEHVPMPKLVPPPPLHSGPLCIPWSARDSGRVLIRRKPNARMGSGTADVGTQFHAPNDPSEDEVVRRSRRVARGSLWCRLGMETVPKSVSDIRGLSVMIPWDQNDLNPKYSQILLSSGHVTNMSSRC